MRVSARNVLPGTVLEVREGEINAEVVVDLGGGDRLAAVVATESCRELGLVEGTPVRVLVKAPWVMLGREDGRCRPAPNRLAGIVRSVAVGAVNAEVGLVLAGGAEVVAVVTKDAVREMGLKPGAAAVALLPASHIVLALAPGAD